MIRTRGATTDGATKRGPGPTASGRLPQSGGEEEGTGLPSSEFEKDLPTADRILGIDVGAETVKIVELRRNGRASPELVRRALVEHGKRPGAALVALLEDFDWETVAAAGATGRASRILDLDRVPTRAALARGVRHAFPGHEPGTVVSIGSHGFLVLEMHGNGHETWRENSRCAQGTGNFVRQLVERFNLDISEAGELCLGVDDPAVLSGRCPVILKTDMTHLANRGGDRAAIVAGLYDAVCKNVQVLLRPRLSPPDVLLVGGVVRAQRVRENFRRHLEEQGMHLVDTAVEDGLYLEALGAALEVAERGKEPPALASLVGRDRTTAFEEVPALGDALSLVERMSPRPPLNGAAMRRIALGFDIGSTGSKALALCLDESKPVWEGYVDTKGDPVQAARTLARTFLEETGSHHRVEIVGATGSGREIVGSLLSSSFGTEPVFVLNEIAAHAEGALHYDDQVDTIFEIGGQDAKYIRLEGGRICDAAMNEACSAGTGSFIAEQGEKFEGVEDVVQMGRVAMEAERGVSLGQHCSVFMAEVIDEAVAAGLAQPPILAGLYDSIVQNFLNRVKGNRSVGNRIFCQGMPFMSDALAAAVARQTGRHVVVPPNPGTIGALGIALLAARGLCRGTTALDLERFLGARVDRRDTFVCPSTKGCGGEGNRCRIERIHTTIKGRRLEFLWGGNCSLYDGGTRRQTLPDRAPDPFRERRGLVRAAIEQTRGAHEAPVVALSEEFTLKSLFPFFATFVRSLGFAVQVHEGGGRADLERGIAGANTAYCAPMQMMLGAMGRILDDEPAFLLVPRLREIPRQAGEEHATTCPIVQATPDVVHRMPASKRTRVLTPRIDMGTGSLDSKRFRQSVRRLARDLGRESDWQAAYEAGRAAQGAFDQGLQTIGRRALAYAAEHDVQPVVVFGRPYTIHNDVLNSNVPGLLREQGALAIPVDCLPLDDETPVFGDLYWGYSQLNIRAAHQIRRTEDLYGVFCSNYACGPDSFTLHFFSYVMENKPFVVIETDGHAGDAGTRTRIEAFLYCVEEDRRMAREEREGRPRTDFGEVDGHTITAGEAKQHQELLLILRMGSGAEVLAEVLKADGLSAETLPLPTRESLRIGRRLTSGKECIPMAITAGSLQQRLARERETTRAIALLLPQANGPCRFGSYHLLHRIILEKTGWLGRVRIVSPSDTDYSADLAPDFGIRMNVALMASDLLLAALHDVRPAEIVRGRAQEIFDRQMAALKRLARAMAPRPVWRSLAELSGGMYGVRSLLVNAAREFRAAKNFSRDLPLVSMVGEIYVRLDPFANDYLIEKLEQRGLRVLLAPLSEWLEYMTHLKLQRREEGRALPGDGAMRSYVARFFQQLTARRLYGVMAEALGWPSRATIPDVLDAADPFLSRELTGEAALTLGGPIHDYKRGLIHGTVAVGPHECLPNKVAEAQFVHVAEETGLLSLIVPVNGDPVDAEILDAFAFEVKRRFAASRPRR